MTPSVNRWCLLLAGLLCALGGAALAREDDLNQPLLIEANDVELIEADRTSIYVGEVQVEQGSMRLRADHVTVYHREDRRPRLIIALGQPASFRQLTDDGATVEAFAHRMEFDAERDELTLLDRAVLVQGADRIASERIVYDRARAHFRAGGAGRVRITITPED